MDHDYDDSLKIKDALQLYFSKYHFENGGYDLKWFKIKVGPIYFPFPNTKSRIAAVKLHDIHHVLTEYKATLRGEAEIGAWEIASGCGKYFVAWVLNSAAFFYGMILFPAYVFRAFLRGRNCADNLYGNTVYDDRLLNRTVGELRGITGLDKKKSNQAAGYVLFFLFCTVLLSCAAIFLCSLVIIARHIFT